MVIVFCKLTHNSRLVIAHNGHPQLNSGMIFVKKGGRPEPMEKKLQQLTASQLVDLLNVERRKFLKALDYNSSPSMLEEIIDTIKTIEKVLAQREQIKIR